jgi:hypothetical protein
MALRWLRWPALYNSCGRIAHNHLASNLTVARTSDTAGLDGVSGVVGETSPSRRRSGLGALAVLFAVAGGSIAAALLFAGLSVGAFALGMVVTFGLSAVTGIRSNVPGAMGVLLAYSLAFVVLTWPVLLLAAGALWGKWE